MNFLKKKGKTENSGSGSWSYLNLVQKSAKISGIFHKPKVITQTMPQINQNLKQIHEAYVYIHTYLHAYRQIYFDSNLQGS